MDTVESWKGYLYSWKVWQFLSCPALSKPKKFRKYFTEHSSLASYHIGWSLINVLSWSSWYDEEEEEDHDHSWQMVELCLEGGGKEGLEEGWKDDQAPLAQECLFALFNILFFI